MGSSSSTAAAGAATESPPQINYYYRNEASQREMYSQPQSRELVKQDKKKKWWKRRSSRNNDPGQHLRDIIANWTLPEIVALVHEYETLTNEKELYIHAESSRAKSSSLRSDLADLLDFKWNSDVNLMLQPAIFPAHRAILSQRSKYFRNLLNNVSTSVNVEDSTVDIPTFSSLLRFLYTEEIPTTVHETHNNTQIVAPIVRPNKPLENDLYELLQTGKYSDLVLILGDDCYSVHKCVLACRSPFFRSLLQRRSNSKKIVLDDNVIPKRYARVILNCMYTDKLDLHLIEPLRNGLTEVEALTFTGKLNPSGFQEAMELYQIGRFLEFDMLCERSEDVITDQISQDTLVEILSWSTESHGSKWVYRQVLMFVQEEYLSLISSSSFLDLDKSTLHVVTQSDFLQASEIDLLNSIIKWGEHQLIKRVEDREPNLVSSTRDSVFRNNHSKKKFKNTHYCSNDNIHLNDNELRDIVFELIRNVRLEHIPLSNEHLVSAIRRGLVSIPPSHMLTEEKCNPWLNSVQQCVNRPRLYTPYYEEAKSCLRVRSTSAGSTESLGSITRLQSTTHLSYLNSIGRIKTLRPIIPDTLYMIDDKIEYHQVFKPHHHEKINIAKNIDKRVDELVIEPELLNGMLSREKKLRSAHLRNLTNPVSRERASSYIRLRVTREFGFPDYVSNLLDERRTKQVSSSVAKEPEAQQQYRVPQKQKVTSAVVVQSTECFNMPDVALNTNDEHEQNIIPTLLDLDLGDNGSQIRNNLPAPSTSSTTSSRVLDRYEYDVREYMSSTLPCSSYQAYSAPRSNTNHHHNPRSQKHPHTHASHYL